MENQPATSGRMFCATSSRILGLSNLFDEIFFSTLMMTAKFVKMLYSSFIPPLEIYIVGFFLFFRKIFIVLRILMEE